MTHTSQAIPQTSCLHDLLAMQSQRTPEAPAIAALGRAPLTYRALWAHSCAMVGQLNAMGLGRQDCVAIVLPEGPEMAVAVLCIAAGMTSAPLNPAYHLEEFDFYLSDLQATALVIQAGMDSPAVTAARQRSIPILELTPTAGREAGLYTLPSTPVAPPSHDGFSEPADVALLLHTSGTTARPKRVPLTQANLCASAYNICAGLQLSASDRCLNVMPLFHIHGLIASLLASLAAGASVVCTPGFDPTAFFGWLEEFGPTWYTAVPTMHQAVLTQAMAHRRGMKDHSLRLIRSCSAALPRRLMVELEHVFNTPVIEAYGMTEAAHQISSNPLPPRARKPGSVGCATGPDVAIMDEAGHLLSHGKQGEIVIRGANVMPGYQGNPSVNQSAFTNGWFRTGDQGYIDPEGYLFITGRLKEVINRGGEKISPREIDDVLLAHPAIIQALTFTIPHVTLGEDIGAAVVLRERAAATEDEIRQFTAARLAAFKVPRRVVILEEIPKGPTGKLQRIGLAQKLGLAGPPQESSQAPRTLVAPRDDLETWLVKIWQSILDLKAVGVADNFFDVGGDSVSAVRLFAAIEATTGKQLPLATLFEAATIEALAAILRQDGWSASWSSLVAIQPVGTKPPFFCVHAVGANVLGYRALAHWVGLDQPFYGLQSVGLDGTQPPHTCVEDMAAHYIKELRSLQPEGPYFLGGGSSGGVIAFEMARQLRAQDHSVALVALLDTYGLGHSRYTPHPERFHSKLYRLAQRADAHVGNLLLHGPKKEYGRILRRVKMGLTGKTTQATSELNVELEPPLAHLIQRVREANYQALQAYTPEVYAGRVTLFLSNEEPARFFHDTRLVWTELATEGADIHIVPGDHGSFIREPHVRVLAEQLQACLHRARELSAMRRCG